MIGTIERTVGAGFGDLAFAPARVFASWLSRRARCLLGRDRHRLHRALLADAVAARADVDPMGLE